MTYNSVMEKTDPKKLRKAVALYQGGYSVSEIVKISGIGKSTIYRELDKQGIPRNKDSTKNEL